MSKRTNTLLWIAFGIGMAITVALLVLEYTKGARERAEIREETHEIVAIETHEETTEETTEATTVAVTTQPTTTVATEETTTEVPTHSVEELAQIVIDSGINGDARKAELGDRYEEVQKWIDENYIPPETSYRQVGEADEYAVSDDYYEYPASYGVLNPSDGVCYFNGHMETYYDLPMQGVIDIMYSLGYSGEYWVRSDGCKMFGDYIMVAADFGWLPRGSVVLTSLGWGMVCDTGSGGSNWIDVAVSGW